MNRQQRRKAMREGKNVPKDPVYNIKQSDIKAMKKDAVNEAANAAMVLLLAIPVKVMYEKYGWRGHKRLPEFADALTEEYEKFCSGETELDEYAQLVYEQTGVKFERTVEE